MAERLLAYEQNIETPVEILDTLGSLAMGTEVSSGSEAKAEIATVDALLEDILGSAAEGIAPQDFIESFEEKSGE